MDVNHFGFFGFWQKRGLQKFFALLMAVLIALPSAAVPVFADDPEGISYNPQEIEKLLAFAQQPGSSGSSNSEILNWDDEGADPSTWDGISWTDIEGIAHVERIVLTDAGVSGSLDVSGFSHLTNLELGCESNESEGNHVTHIDARQCTALENIVAPRNGLMTLQLEGSTGIKYMHLWQNKLSAINVQEFTWLEELNVDYNALNTLDVSQNTSLKKLWVGGNLFTEINLNNNVELEELYIYDGQLTALDVSTLQYLNTLRARNNPFIYIDISNNPNLTEENFEVDERVTVKGNENIADRVGVVEQYNADEVAKLTAFANQDDNLTKLGWNLDDPGSWNGINWLSDEENEKRVKDIDLADKELSGSLDASGFSSLMWLNVGRSTDDSAGNHLSQIDVSGCTALTALHAFHNNLTTLGLSGNENLNELFIWNNQLESVDLSDCVALERLHVDNNNSISSLDTSRCVNLKDLYVNGNKISTLNLADNTALEVLSAGQNQLTSIDLSNLVSLRELDLSQNPLESLPSLNAVTSLEKIHIYDTGIHTIDISALTNLKELNISGNQLTALNLSSNTRLENLYLWNNGLTTLDVSALTELKELNCSDNPLGTLNVAQNTQLRGLWVVGTQVKSLSLAANALLEQLDIGWNDISTLDLSGNPMLKSLSMQGTSITSLDVSQNGNLEELSFNVNRLTSLDVSMLTKLKVLSGRVNNLASIDVTGLPLEVLEIDEKTRVIGSTLVPDAEEQQYGDTGLRYKEWDDGTVVITSFLLTESFDKNIAIPSEINGKPVTKIGSAAFYEWGRILELQNVEIPHGVTSIGERAFYRTSLNRVWLPDSMTDLREGAFQECWNLERIRIGADAVNLGRDVFGGCAGSLTIYGERGSAAEQYANDWGIAFDDVENFDKELPINEYELQMLHAFADQGSNRENLGWNPENPLGWEGVEWTYAGEEKRVKSLNLSDKGLTGTLDVSNFSELEWLNVAPDENSDGNNPNRLTGLNASGCSQLREILAYENALTTINITNLPSLETANFSDNKLTSINFAGTTALKYLWVPANNLQAIDISSLVNLTDFACQVNQITSLDTSKNTQLRLLDFGENPLKQINLSKNSKLEELYTWDSELTALNIDNLTELTILHAGENKLTGINTTHNKKLVELRLDGNQLSSIDFSANTELERLNLTNTGITTPNLSGLTKLTELNLSDNPLAELNIASNTQLRCLDVVNVQLQSIDVSRNTQLEYLNCSWNQLEDIDLSQNTALISLTVDGAFLPDVTQIDLSHNTNLEELHFFHNRFTSIDVSKLTKLKRLYGYINNLTEIDVTGLPLEVLEVDDWVRVIGSNLVPDVTEQALGETGLRYKEWDDGTVAITSFTPPEHFDGKLVIPGTINNKPVKRIGNGAFFRFDTDMRIRSVTLPEGITSIGSRAFKDTGIRRLWLPDSVTTIQDGAFEGCWNLNRIRIGENAVNFGWDIFGGCGGYLTIYGEQGSAAEQYANDCGIAFADTDEFYTELPFNQNDLDKLKDFANQDQNKVKLGWDMEEPIDWTGIDWVEVNGENRARDIYLPDLGLTGSLDVSGFTALEWLNIAPDGEDSQNHNSITGLNVAGAAKLIGVFAHDNKLQGTINISNLPCLEIVHFDCNELTGIILTGSTALRELWLAGNQLKNVDLKDNVNLELLNLDDNQLTDIKLSSLTKLNNLRVGNNKISSIDLNKNTRLEHLSVSGNGLTNLTVRMLPNLQMVDISNNKLTAIDLTANTQLGELYAQGNLFKVINLTKNPKLRTIFLSENQLATLNVTNMPELEELFCWGNLFTSVDVTKNAKLRRLDVGGLQLTQLDVTKNPLLEELTCPWNQLSSLDVTKNTELVHLDVGSNNLTALDITNNPKLESLYFFYNPLTSLDVSKNKELRLLSGCVCKLSEIDITGLDKLEVLAIDERTRIVGSTVIPEIEEIPYGDTGLRYKAWNQFVCITSFTPPQNFNGVVEIPAYIQEMPVRVIGNGAFYQWEEFGELKEVMIPDTVEYIGERAFAMCTSLTRVALPDSVVELGPEVFWNCSSLSRVRVPAVTTNIYRDVFSGCPVTIYGGAGSVAEQYAGDYGIPFADINDFDKEMPINENERTKLVAFANQGSNLAKLGWNLNEDPGSWSGVQWRETENERRVVCLNFEGKGVTGSLDVSGFTALELLFLGTGETEINNGITGLTTTGATALRHVDVSSNVLTALDLSNLPMLEGVYATGNQIARITLSGSTEIRELYVNDNRLTAFDPSALTALEVLVVDNNPITSIDTTKNTNLTFLDVGNMRLTSLDVTKNMKLDGLSFYGNQISGIDLSRNIMLKYINAGENRLTQLNISKNTELDTLYFYHNELTALDVSKLKKLKVLGGYINKLSVIDVTGLPLELLEIDEKTRVVGSTLAPNTDEQIDSSTGLRYKVWLDNTVVITSFTPPAGFTGVVTIPEKINGKNVTKIGSGAFYQWGAFPALKKVTIPEGVTSIGERAFAGCTSLTKISLPNGVKTIRPQAFMGCTSLKEIRVPASVDDFWSDIFKDCSQTLTIYGELGSDIESFAHDFDIAFAEISSYASNTAPIALPLSIEVNYTAPRTGKVTASDAEGDTLTYSLVGAVTNGTVTTEYGKVTINGQGDFTYTFTGSFPSDKASVQDSFAFKADDGSLDSEPATVSITVTPGLVEGLTLNQKSLTLSTPAKAGSGITPKNSTVEKLVAAVNQGAINQNVTWKSSNTSVAKVDSNGVVTAVGKGTANITVTTVGKNANNAAISKTCVVTVEQTVTGVTVANISVVKGESVDKKVTVTPANANYIIGEWAIADETIAKIDSDGKVLGLKGGKTTISYILPEVTATATITVEQPVISITLTGMQGDKVTKGTVIQLTPVFNPVDTTNQAVAYKSSKPAVASVDAAGKVVALTSGTTVITATTVGKDKTNKTVSASYTLEVVTAPTAITLNSTSETIIKKGSFTLVPTVTPADASDKTVKWVVTDTSGKVLDDADQILTITNGKVTAVGTNDTKAVLVWAISNADEKVKSACLVNISVPAEGVTLDGEGAASGKVAITTTQTLKLSETVTPLNADNRSVVWASSNPKAATVDETGMVTPVAKGTAVISATTVDKGKKASVTVTVTELMTGIALNVQSIELAEGKSYTLLPTVSPATASSTAVDWAVTNPDGSPLSDTQKSLITFTSGGKITANKGSAGQKVKMTATAKDGSGITASCEITIIAELVSKLIISTPAPTLYANSAGEQLAAFPTTARLELKAVINKEEVSYENSKVVWKSANDKIATVDAAGVVTAVGKGKANITATATDGSGQSVSVSVTVKKLVESITLDVSEVTIAQGKKATIKASVLPADADLKTIQWASSNPANCPVSSSGAVTANATGNYSITATANDNSGVNATAVVTVAAAPKTVEIRSDLYNQTIEIGESAGLTATVKDSQGNADTVSQTVTWASSNKNVVAVDANGVITAVAKGSADITAKTTDGTNISSQKYRITVNVAVTGVTLNKTILVLKKGKTETLKAAITPANATNLALTWDKVSGDEDISIDVKSGKVTVANKITAEDGDTAIVRVTTADGSFTATCQVVVAAVQVKSVSLDKTSHDFTAKEGFIDSLRPLQLKHTIKSDTTNVEPSNTNVTWSSTNEQIAVVDADGRVTPKGFGTARITVTTEDGFKTASCTVNVYPTAKADKLAAVEATKTIELASVQDGIADWSLKVKNQADKELLNTLFTYSSSNAKVAVVDEYGHVTAPENGVAGTAKITAALTNDLAKRKVVFTVNVVPQQVQNVDISYSLPNPDGSGVLELTNQNLELLFTANQRIELSALQTTGSGSVVTTKPVWKSSNTAVATVAVTTSGNAVVTFKRAGTVTISAQANDKLKAINSIDITAFDFTPKVIGTITVNRLSNLDVEARYTSTRFGLETVNNEETQTVIQNVATDTIKLGSNFLPNSLITLEAIGNGWVVKADESVKAGTYAVTATVVLADDGISSSVRATTGSDTITTKVTLSVKVISGKASVKVSIPKVNLFYAEPSVPLTFTTAETITNVVLVNNTNARFTEICGVNYEDTEGSWRLYWNDTQDNSPNSLSGYMDVYLENYDDPIRLSVTVGKITTAPKLSAIIQYESDSKTASVFLTNTTDKVPLTDYGANLSAKYNSSLFNLEVEDDMLVLTPVNEDTVKPGTTYSVEAIISKDDWGDNTIPLKISVKFPS